MSFRTYYSWTYEQILQEEINLYGDSDYWIGFCKKTAKKRHRMYACLFNRDVSNVIIKEDSTCNYCGEKNNLTVDHIIPISKGGENKISNTQILCGFCNSKKGNH